MAPMYLAMALSVIVAIAVVAIIAVPRLRDPDFGARQEARRAQEEASTWHGEFDAEDDGNDDEHAEQREPAMAGAAVGGSGGAGASAPASVVPAPTTTGSRGRILTKRDVPAEYPDSTRGSHRWSREFGTAVEWPGPRHAR